MVITWALAEHGVESVSTRVHADNIASQKVLEAAGFLRTDVEENAEGGHRDFVYERRG